MNIKNKKTDAIVVPGNTSGVMNTGSAVDILESSGIEIQQELQEKKLELGSWACTSSGQMKKKRGVNLIYHAIIYSHPKALTSSHLVRQSLEGILKNAIKRGCKSISVSPLGGGRGGLLYEVLGGVLLDLSYQFHSKIDIFIVGMDEQFIDYLIEINFLKAGKD